jgi:hemoglobin
MIKQPIDATLRHIPGAASGVTEETIKAVVHNFYKRIQSDPTLGPIFLNEVHDWDPHLAKMCDFWSSVLLMSKRYDGRPVPAHLKIGGLDKNHFECWLDLFRKTATDCAPPEAASIFIDRAERIAQSLLLSIDYHRGVLPELKAPIRAG